MDIAVVCACVRLNELIARVLFLMWLNWMSVKIRQRYIAKNGVYYFLIYQVKVKIKLQDTIHSSYYIH